MKIQKRTAKKVAFLALIVFLAGSHAIAADVNLAWDANTEADLAGYKVYYGTAIRVYGTPTPVGKITAYTITGLTPGTYYFAITAVNAGGQESGYSNEVFTSIADVTPPTVAITSPTSSGSYSTSSATLSMGGTASDNVGVTQVTWANSRGGSGTATGTTSWSVTLTLQSGSNVITMTAQDAAANSGTALLRVNYTAPDQTPPVITAVVSFEINGTSTRIQWLTNEEADSQGEYGTSTAYGSVISGDAKITTLHSVVLTGLTSKTLYHYRVRSRDAAGNQAVSSDHTFTLGTGQAGSNRILTYPRLSLVGLNSPGATSDSYVGVALTNLSPVTANLIFTAFDRAGTPLSGPGITNPASRVLNAGQQLPIVDTELFGSACSSKDATGWIKVESDVEGVVGFFLMFNSNISMLDGANLSSTPLDSFVLPEIQEKGFTRVHVTNANNETATIIIDLLRANGTLHTSATLLVSSNGALVADVFGELFAGVAPAASDYLRVTSSKGVLPFEMIGENGQDMAMLGGLDRNGGGSALYAPQYVVGGQYKSTLSIINLDPAPGTMHLRLFGENGIQIGESRVMSISGNGKVYIDDQSFFIPAGQDILQGYVQVVSDGIRVTGSVTFGDVKGKGFTTALPMVSTLLNSVLFGHIASNDIYFTGFALLNPNNEETIASVALYSAAGLLQNSKEVRIPARQRKSGVLTEFFPELIGQDRTSGYVKVMADKGMASYAVFGTNKLSALSAIPPQIAP